MKKFFARIVKFFKDIRIELKKVIWPSWNQVRNNTGIVIIFIFIVGIGIWVLDYLFGLGATAVLSK